MGKDTRKRVKMTFTEAEYRKATKVRKALFPYALESTGYREVIMYLYDNLGAIRDFVTAGDQKTPKVHTPDPARVGASVPEKEEEKKKKNGQAVAPLDLTKRVLADLNKRKGSKEGRGFQAKGMATRRLIAARLNDGFTEADLIDVNRKMCAEWMGGDMQKYLRPKTLYQAENFENYVGGDEPEDVSPESQLEWFDD